ncbi:GBF-interacting protein 1-like [Salvia splendens]|uniref:GBF-interacting protein 1-like n=1 Tax=Salvia splendens TaxID=180675 RepID=UPI001C27B3BF|nr:GBF-interacting protein 1-like [Salvia splendens]
MSDFSRVSVPESLRRTIDDIKEIAGQHSDEDIHAMLQECNMDPNETAQKLLYLDTFHEVKRKRDRRKVRRGTRGGGNRYSSAGRTGRQPNVSMGRDSKSFVAVEQKERNSYARAAYDGSPIHEWNSQIAEQNIKGAAKETKTVCDGTSKRLPSLRAISVKHIANIDPGPTPTSTPIASTARTPGGNLKPKCNHVGNSVGLYSSATDPVLVPSLNPRNPASVGIIQRETGSQRNASEISASLVEDSKMSDVHNATFGQGSVGVTSETQPIEYEGVGSSQSESTTTHPTAADAKGHQETCLAQPDSAPSKGMSESVVVLSEANLDSLPTVEDPSPDITTSDVDIKLHSGRHSVIFPNNLYVPEAFKNSIMFGSVESSLRESNGSSPTVESSGIDTEVSKEPSEIPQSSSSVSGCNDYLDRPLAPPHVLVDLKPSQENAVSLRYDGQSKEEVLQPVGGSHNPPATSDYSLNLVPPAVQLETQGGNSVVLSTSSTPTMTQPRGIPQGSIAAVSVSPPQIYPYLRQAYPTNYIPYNPYYSQLYMPPQHAHQLLSHSGFPHQPSAGNIYMPPTSAAPGAKLPVPPSYKPGNMAHYGISSGYGSYGTSGLGYGSTGAHDNAGTELKDKNIYSTIKQNEDLHALHDPSGVQTNMVYNVPQAYQAAGRNSFGGIYHQSMAGPRSVHQPQQATSEVALTSYSSQPQQQQLLPLPQHYGHQMNRRENV